MKPVEEFDLQIDRAPNSTDYLHVHYHRLLPKEVRVWVNGEKIRLTLEEVQILHTFIQTILSTAQKERGIEDAVRWYCRE